MRAVRVWLRLDLRRRWRSLAVLALLIALAGGTVMTTLAGARRGASASERLLARTSPAVAAIPANVPGLDWSGIRQLPEVSAFSFFGASPTIEGLPPQVEVDALISASTMRTIERPVIFSGRLFDFDRSDEAIVTPKFVKNFHKGVGDTVVARLMTPAELKAGGGSGPGGQLSGPRVVVKIVGVGMSAWYGDSSTGIGGIVLSPGLAARYRANLVGVSADPDRPEYANAIVRLNGGRAAIPQLRADVARVTGRSDIDVWDLAVQVWRPYLQQADFEARCLGAFGGVALLASLFLIGPALSRLVSASGPELRTLRSLGMSSRQAVAAATSAAMLAAVIGAGLAVGAAVLASRLFPLGIAATVEPSRGVSVDALVLAGGAGVLLLLVAAGASASAVLALHSRNSGSGRRSGAVAAGARAGLPVPMIVGASFALEGGPDRGGRAIRPALFGAVAGVLGVLAAFVFSTGVNDAAQHPERFGQTYQLSGFLGDNGQDYVPSAGLIRALRSDPDVTGVDDGRVAVASGTSGDASVTLYSDSQGPKPMDVVVTKGRRPRAANEILLAPQSLSALHTGVGHQVRLTGSRGRTTFTVTGTGFVPVGFHNGYADGGWVTNSGFDALFTRLKFHLVYVALRPAARTSDAGAILTRAMASIDPAYANVAFEAPPELLQVVALHEVRRLPAALGIFLALLAIGAIGHGLATAVRRRAHDLAVLRALGLTRWQCRWIVVTQASLLALVGLAFGVPLGLAVGRTVWRTIADTTPFQYVSPVVVWAPLLAVPAALVVANLLAAGPSRRAARLRVAQILRAE
jgi:hypothetical protein